jgi:hypothetical protein
MFPYCPNILLITAAAERRGIKPYRLTPNKKNPDYIKNHILKYYEVGNLYDYFSGYGSDDKSAIEKFKSVGIEGERHMSGNVTVYDNNYIQSLDPKFKQLSADIYRQSDIEKNEDGWTSKASLSHCIYIKHPINGMFSRHNSFFEIEDTGETYIFNFYHVELHKLRWDSSRQECDYNPFTGINQKGERSSALIIDLGTHDLQYAKSITKDAIKLVDTLLGTKDYKRKTDVFPDLEKQIKYQLQNPQRNFFHHLRKKLTPTKTPEQSPAPGSQIGIAQKTGYVQGVCESILAFNNDENRKIMTEATITFLSKKLLSEMNVTKDTARKFANPETYKALEQSVFAPEQEHRLEQTQSQRRGI